MGLFGSAWRTSMGFASPFFLSILTVFAVACPVPARAQTPEGAPVAGLAFADIADLVTAAPYVIKARIKSTQTVTFPATTEGKDGPRYLLVEVNVTSLIRGADGIAPVISFLAHPERKQAELRRNNDVLLFARPTARPGQIRLVSRNASQPATPEMEGTVRGLAEQLLASDSPPAITDVADAFHVAGTVAGESETQIFLKTRTGDPVSLSVLRRPGQVPRWGVSLGEIVDETAVPPQRGTLLWYRLACGLPQNLPAASTRSLSATDMAAAQRDYKLVMESLGSCGRTL